MKGMIVITHCPVFNVTNLQDVIRRASPTANAVGGGKVFPP